ncbi:PIG-L family deacetylase, partial [archaeon]|nr:PIG-L family deacetylase [archaeon]
MPNKNIIIFVAHSDDEAAGLGGTIIKYSKKYNIIKVVFSAGEKSHPHYREEVIIEKRIKETEKISKRFGIKENIYLHLQDSKLKDLVEDEGVKNEVKKIIKKYKPIKIFTLTSHDPHIDHRAVNKVVREVVKDMKYKCEFYLFEVWNLIKEDLPVVYEDITQEFYRKID